MVQKNRTHKARRQTAPYESLHDWMERTGTNGRQLLAKLRAAGFQLSEGHLSNILKGSRRCSLRTAIGLNEVTGVPIRTIAQWPPRAVQDDRTSQAVA